MVRTLDSVLTTALNNVTRVPAFKLTIEDHVIHYARYRTPGVADACIAAQLLDADTLIDSATPTGSGQNSVCRITRVLAHFDAQHCLYDLQLELEGL